MHCRKTYLKFLKNWYSLKFMVSFQNFKHNTIWTTRKLSLQSLKMELIFFDKIILSLQSLKMILILFWLIGLPTLLWWRSVSWCWPQSVMPSSKWWWKLAVQILSLQISLRRNTVTPWSYSRPCSSSPTLGQRSWHEPWDWGLDNSYWTRYFNGNHSYLKHTNINMALSLNV